MGHAGDGGVAERAGAPGPSGPRGGRPAPRDDPRPGETAGEWWANTGQAQARREKDERDGRPTDGDFDPATYFLHDLPPGVIQASRGQARQQSDTPFGQLWPLAAWPDVPTRVLAARDDRFFPVEFQRRVSEERLGITPDEMPGGHLVALGHPAELAGRLATYRTPPDLRSRHRVREPIAPPAAHADAGRLLASRGIAAKGG